MDAAIAFFLPDYPNALGRANTFDAKVQSDASKISTDYASIVSLSIRQALGACEITISKSSSGAWNTSDIMMFLKEISSDGVSYTSPSRAFGVTYDVSILTRTLARLT